MANKNLLKSKAVIKAISIGLAAMMAMTPVVGATDVYADDVDGNEGESGKSNISESQSESSENNTQSSENNTQAVEESYEQAKEELVPEIPQDATVTTDTTDGVTTEKTEFTETSENVITDITVEKKTSEDGSSEDITVTTDETTTKSEETTEYEYTYNNETVTVTKEEYAQKIAESKAGKDQDGKDLVFTSSVPSSEYVLDDLGNKIGVKTIITEVATFIDEEGFETTKTVTTTVINYINPDIVAPNAPTPADPDKISLGEATDNSSSTAVLPDGTIIIETSEKKASAYKSEKSESEAATTVNNKVSEETVEIKSSGKKTETISSFNTEAEANEMLDTLEDKDKESVSVVKNEDGTFKLVKTVYVQVDEPEDITVQSGDGVAEFDILVNSKYSESDGWKIVKSETDEVSGTTTWTVTKTVGDLTTKYTYKFTPEKRNETAPESSVTTSAKTADEFAKNHLSEYTAENSGWTVSKNTDGNTTIWTISKKDGDTTTQYTYKFTVTESTSTATKTSVKTNATTNEGFLAELKDNYKDGISNGSVTITDNNDGTYTVVKKGANSYETITETYTYSSSSVVTIPEVTAATWNEFVNAFEGNKNASIDELNKECTVTTKSEDGTTTIITYTFKEGTPVKSKAETVTTTSLNASDFEAELKKQFAGWEFSTIDTTSNPGYAVWKVSKSENGTKTEYKYSFKYESGDAKHFTPTAKDEKSFKSELIDAYGEANVSISSKEVDGVTTTTYTCTKEVDGLTQTYVYTSTVTEKADEFYTTATSVGEFEALISSKYPGYDINFEEKIHGNKGNSADTCICTVTKDGKTVAIYEYWVSPDSGHDSKEEKLKGKTIEEYLKEKYPTDNGWTIESIGDNKWKASRPQNDNHTYVQIITLNDATPDEFTEEEISAWEKDIYNNHKESEGWTVTKDGDNKWVAVKKFGKVTIDEVVYELTENGTTKSVTRKVEKSTLGEILGDEVFSKDAPVVNASNYQAYTLISAGDAIIGCHENGGVYAGGEIGTNKGDGTVNKNGAVMIDDWFGAVLYDKDGTVNLQNCDNQNRIERKEVDKTSDEIKEYWNGVANSVIESCSLATQKFIDGVYQVKGQIVANYDEWLEKANPGENPFYKFMDALKECKALLTGNTGFQPAQDGSGETGDSNLVIVSRTSEKITVLNWLGNLNLGLLLAPNADIEVEGNNFTGTLIGNNIVNNAESHTNIRSEEKIETETKKVGKSVTVEQYKVNAKQKLAEMICTLSDPKVVADREKTEVSSTVDAKGLTFSASMESSKKTLNVNASSKTDTITDSKLEKAKEGVKKETISIKKEFEKSSSEKLGSKVTSKTTITNKKSVVILGKKVSETGTRVVTPPPTTPPVTPPPTTPPTTPPPTTPPVTPPSITPPTPVTPDTPTEGVLGERREVSPDASVLGARRRVLGARRGVLGEKRVLGARTEDTSNAAGAVGVMLGSVALSGVWMTLRRKKKIQ